MTHKGLDAQPERASTISRLPVWAKILLAFACLYLFVVAIGAMSTAFKSMGGSEVKGLLSADTNPIVALSIGILVTAFVQSSSTVSSALVGLVAAGQVPLEIAVYMIMGANVGTTVTNALVSLGHIVRVHEFRRAFAAATVHDFFNLLVLSVLFPLEWATGFLTHLSDFALDAFQGVGGAELANPVGAVTKPAIGLLKDLALGNSIALLLLSLILIYATLLSLVATLKALTMHKIENLFDRVIFRTATHSLVFGILLTLLVQSSSVTTSMAVPLVGAGLLTVRQVFPYTMGANIGTTSTALLAAMAAMAAASTAAERKTMEVGLLVAFHHVFFNVIGVALLWWAQSIPVRMAEAFASLAVRNRLIPVLFIVFTFFILPALIIYLGS